jgi:hypothetical protein
MRILAAEYVCQTGKNLIIVSPVRRSSSTVQASDTEIVLHSLAFLRENGQVVLQQGFVYHGLITARSAKAVNARRRYKPHVHEREIAACTEQTCSTNLTIQKASVCFNPESGSPGKDPRCGGMIEATLRCQTSKVPKYQMNTIPTL